MDPYRLFVYGDDGRLIDAEAVAQPEATSGPFDAELLDIEGLRIVKYLSGHGKAPPQAAE